MTTILGNTVVSVDGSLSSESVQASALLTPLRTFEALTVSINPTAPNAAGAASFTLDTQQKIDDYLSSESTTAFDSLQSFWDSLPKNIEHTITMNVAAETITGLSDFRDKIVTATVSIVGDPDPVNWTEVHPGATVQSHQVGSLDPFLTFPASTFPNDGSLKGESVVTSDGYVGVIWDHDDSTLFLTSNLDPAPTNGVTTATVRTRETVLQATSGTHVLRLSTGRQGGLGQFVLTDILFDLDATTAAIEAGSGTISLTGCQFDLQNSSAGGAIQQLQSNDFTTLTSCSVVGQPNPGNDYAFELSGSAFQLWNCYITGGEDGISVFSPVFLFIQATVFDNASDGTGFSGVPSGINLHSADGAGIQFAQFGGFRPGVRTQFRNFPSGVPCINFDKGSFVRSPTGSVHFENNAGPIVRIGSRVSLDLSIFPGGEGFIDEGGNGDVGFDLVGSFSELVLSTDTDITGTNGDVRIGSDDPIAYADISAEEISDLARFNNVRRV